MDIQNFLQLLKEEKPSTFNKLSDEEKIEKVRQALKNSEGKEFTSSPNGLLKNIGVGKVFYVNKIKPNIEAWGLKNDYQNFLERNKKEPNPNAHIFYCPVCDYKTTSGSSWQNHMAKNHPQEYETIRRRKKLYVCKYCGEELGTNYRIGWNNHKLNCPTFSKLITPKGGHKHTDEEKTKLSEIRKKWLNDNPEKHVWRLNTKFISKPCEYLKAELSKQGYPIVAEYQPLLDQKRYFAIDISIPEKKIGIEVNGNQHYDDAGNQILKEYYKKRHDAITQAGWDLKEIHYSEAFTKLDEIIAWLNQHGVEPNK